MLTNLAGAYFIEQEENLARRVELHWKDLASRGLAPKFSRLGRDVWDPFRAQLQVLTSFCFSLPVGAVVFLIGGPPCTNLTRAGHRQGALGLCGRESVHFYAFPIYSWFIQFMRPDVCVLGYVENAHNMLRHWSETICKALGVPCDTRHGHFTNPMEWTAMARKRWVFSTYPHARRLVPPTLPQQHMHDR